MSKFKTLQTLLSDKMKSIFNFTFWIDIEAAIE